MGSKALVFCVDLNRRFDLAAHLNYSNPPTDLVSFITSSTDTILAAQTAAIAARSMGIDSMFTNCIHRVDLHEVYKLLNLPEQKCFPFIELILGYSDTESTQLRGRLDGTGIIHYGKYSRLTEAEMDGLIDAYDDKQKKIAMIGNWDEKGFNHYLDYYFTEWDHPTAEEKIREFHEILENAGFLNAEYMNGGK